ncbi:MAG: tetratricopeptide repeat protein [Caldisericia bacterium]|nr:tetratricopeptide repeat protein [Caldisericia bacterium]
MPDEDLQTDHTIKLAFSMQSNKGVYALLLGSGISISSGIPTGWGVVCDLITKLAELHGEEAGEEPWVWYESKFKKQADYSELLDSLASTPTERSKILTTYFEPNEKERKQGKKLPSPAHRAIANLISAGIIKVIITTNFDRLLEKALSDININPRVVSTTDDLKGLPSLIHMERPLIIKVNGDYLDTRIKNTQEELRHYEPEMNSLLKKIFSEYGLIISGWSGRYDTALIECYRSSINKKLSTLWIDPSGLSGGSKELLELRGGTYIKATSDEFFPDLAEKLSVDESTNINTSISKEKKSDTPNNLPDGLSTFVGREKEITEITAILKKDRLVTFLGTGGSGKTRLSIEVAREHLDQFSFGVWFSDLSQVTDPTQIIQIIAVTMGIKEEPGKPLTKSIEENIGEENVLLVFDNCEQIASGIADIVEEFLDCCPNLKIVTTSREALEVDGEKLWFIPSMPLPKKTQENISNIMKFAGIKLFVERAKAVSPDFKLTEENAESVISICQRLDGLPLAIELAAARIKVLSPSQIDKKLDKRFKLLTKGARSATDRQKTLRGAIDWSYDLLSADEKTLFNRVSVFTGGFTLESATAVATGNYDFEVDDKDLQKLYLDQKQKEKENTNQLTNQNNTTNQEDHFIDLDEFEILDLIDQLHSKSLIVSKKTSQDETRYHFLQSIKEYALQKLEQTNETTLIKTRHLEWFTVWAKVNSKKLRGSEQALWFARFEDEHNNIIASLEYAKESTQNLLFVSLITFTCIFWNIMGYHKLAYKWTKAALAINCKRSKTLAVLYLNNGVFAHWLKKLDEAIEVTELSLEIYKELGLTKQTAVSLQNLAIYIQDKGKIEKSIELYKQVETICIETNNESGLAFNKMNLGMCYSDMSLYEKALDHLKTALKLFNSLSDYRAQAWTLRSIAKIYISLLDLKTAEKYLDDALTASQKANVHFEEMQTLQRLGNLYTVIGRYEKALDTYEHIKKLSQNQLQDIGTDYYRTCTIEAHLFMGDFEKAKLYSERAGLFDKSKKLDSYSTNKLMAMVLYYLFAEDIKNADEIIQILDERFETVKSLSKRNRFLLYKGFLDYQKGNYEASEKWLKKCLSSFFSSNALLRVVDCLEFISKIKAKQQKLKEASIILGASEQMRKHYGVPIPPVMKRHMDELNKILKDFFGRAFENFKEKGASMTTEDVVIFALQI